MANKLDRRTAPQHFTVFQGPPSAPMARPSRAARGHWEMRMTGETYRCGKLTVHHGEREWVRGDGTFDAKPNRVAAEASYLCANCDTRSGPPSRSPTAP